ncbi:MAG: YdcH family protein [Alphaproteobacteria bacterium]
MQEDQEELRLKLAEYMSEHRALDELIESAINSDTPVNLLRLQQMKKKKLWLKDMIKKIESDLIDDIIA